MTEEHHVHKYSRRTYANRDVPEADTQNQEESSPRREAVWDEPSCSCGRDNEGGIDSILHKKCAVISLAQKQLQRLLDTESYVCSNAHRYRSVYDFLRLLKASLAEQSKCQCILMMLIGISFGLGLLLGACSCGSYLGKFESPILTCLDNMFINEGTAVQESLRGIF